MVELHPSKVAVTSSTLVACFFICAHVAQLVEHILGKDEVHGFESRRGLNILREQSLHNIRINNNY